jgi:hypothetical protein
MQQLKTLEVSSFLSDPFHDYENRLLLKDFIILRNIGEDHKVLGEIYGGEKDQQRRPSQEGGPAQVEFEPSGT